MYSKGYLGNSLYQSNSATYRKEVIQGKIVWRVVSWIDKRCKKCGRFIFRLNTGRFCQICTKNYHKEYSQRYKDAIKFGKVLK
jgi:uncharacterized Zn finger protein (UPF0148 family)